MAHHYESVTSTESPSAGELVSRVSEQLSQLIRDELKLARTELTEKGKKAGVAGGLYGGAGLIALYGVAAFVAAAILGLAGPVSDWAAALIVGAVLFVVAGVAALLGRREAAQASPPLPQEAVAGLKEDIQIVKDGVRR